jgi:SAM-dependent methyltransferase
MLGRKYRTSDSDIWDHVWDKQHALGSELQWNLERDLSIMRWGMFRQFAEKELGNLAGYTSVELGAGRGIASLQLAMLGVQVALIDWSERALETAANLYSFFGLRPKLIKADIIDLPAAQVGVYDISVSVGVAEHFVGEEREAVIQSHATVLKPGGISLISVPNSLCLPYRFWKYIQERRGKWPFGLEVPFTQAELTRLAVKHGLQPVRIVGSSLGEAIHHFVWRGYVETILQRVIGLKPRTMESDGPLGHVPQQTLGERENCLDHKIGYLLNLFARKPATSE